MEKKHEWIAEVLADIGDYCDMNGLYDLRGAITRAELSLHCPRIATSIGTAQKDNGGVRLLKRQR